MNTEAFGQFLQQSGLKQFVGVPCSYLAPLINWAINENALMMANNEGEAIAIASGISLVKKPSEFGVVFMQNSGLSNALSPLTSLNAVFELPILGFVSWRGESQDEPQHALMGKITDQMLKLCHIEVDYLSADFTTAQTQLLRALSCLKRGQSFFFIVRKNVFEPVALKIQTSDSFIQHSTLLQGDSNSAQPPSLVEALTLIQNQGRESLILTSTGFASRVLFDLNDLPNQFYMVGSMGCVSALGLGVSLKTTLPVLAVDGDSALLMRLGTLVANGFYGQNRAFCHILLNNHCHLSTGGQKNLSHRTHFTQIAHHCGYARCVQTHSLADFERALDQFFQQPQCTFIELFTNCALPQHLSRPNLSFPEVASRFALWIRSHEKFCLS